MWTDLRWLSKGTNRGVINIFHLFDNSAITSDLTASDVWMTGQKGMGKYAKEVAVA